jgi:hypothetical protein
MNLAQVKELNIPTGPGSYQYYDKTGKVIYIGKAANLRSRVLSYWRESADHTPAKEQMLTRIAKIKWIETDTEIEALLLEANLVKKISTILQRFAARRQALCLYQNFYRRRMAARLFYPRDRKIRALFRPIHQLRIRARSFKNNPPHLALPILRDHAEKSLSLLPHRPMPWHVPISGFAC